MLNKMNETVLLRLWFSIDVRKNLNILETQTKPADQSFEPDKYKHKLVLTDILRTN